jgi:hypothetical protein
MKAEKEQVQKSGTSAGGFTFRQPSLRSPFSFVLGSGQIEVISSIN